MEYLIGFVLGAVVCAFAKFSGFDRERVFYPTVACVVATYYSLFAVMGRSTPALVVEALVGCVFFALAAAGFRKSLWLIVVALVGHGAFDAVHHIFIENPGMPIWWPGFCGSIDVFMGGYLAFLLKRAVAGTGQAHAADFAGGGEDGGLAESVFVKGVRAGRDPG